ncbi:MAG: hypothetical protein V1754_13695, partial [Pseudomonadota bacterium]
EPNIFVAETFRTEEFFLRGTLLLNRKHHLELAASAGYQYSQSLNLETNISGDPLHIVVTDTSLLWQTTDHIQLALRYQLTAQEAKTQLGTQESVLSYYRNVIMLTATALYPVERGRRQLRRQSGRLGSNTEWNGLFQSGTGQQPNPTASNK